jgi:quinol monooxygenase YgiN
MIIVSGTARFANGEIAKIKDALERNVAATRAEPGCARYAYSIDISDPDLLHIGEEWSDEEAIAAHMAAPHMAELMAALGDAKLETIRVDAYEAHFLKTLLGGS